MLFVDPSISGANILRYAVRELAQQKGIRALVQDIAMVRHEGYQVLQQEVLMLMWT
jgi:hypothetical protein